MWSDAESSERCQNFFEEPQLSLSWVSLSRSFSTDEFGEKNLFERVDDPFSSILIHDDQESQNLINESQPSSKDSEAQKDAKKTKRIVKKRNFVGCKCTKNQCNNNYCSCKRENNKCSSDCGCIGCMNNSFIKKIACRIEDFSFFTFDYNNKQQYHINNL